ncbi:MAG: transcriptional repressor [archaeon]
MERQTKQRRVIIEELGKLSKLRIHPTASELYVEIRKKLPRISLGTVYRNLEDLSKEGQIVKVNCNSFCRFDIHNEKEKYHVICRRCEKVFDIKQPIKISFDKEAFEKETGFKVLDLRINICGICKNCKNKR